MRHCVVPLLFGPVLGLWDGVKKVEKIYRKGIDKRATVWYNTEEKEVEQPFSPGRHERAWVDIENFCGQNSLRAVCSFGRLCGFPDDIFLSEVYGY